LRRFDGPERHRQRAPERIERRRTDSQTHVHARRNVSDLLRRHAGSDQLLDDLTSLVGTNAALH